MVTFDAATRETCIVRANRTNTPLQALNLMNDVTYLEASRKFAERMMKEGGSSPEARIDYAFSVALARSAKPRRAGCAGGDLQTVPRRASKPSRMPPRSTSRKGNRLATKA